MDLIAQAVAKREKLRAELQRVVRGELSQNR